MDNEIVGYERPMSWMQALFPGQTVEGRVCVDCYNLAPDPAAKPLTRQQVVTECTALRDLGVEHTGPSVDWQGLAEEQCWRCGKYLTTGKAAPKRLIDGVSFARRMPYPLRHLLVRNPQYLTNAYPDMTETERLEVVAYLTRRQRTQQSYQDMGTEDRLAAVENLLQQWRDLADQIAASNDCLLPEQAETKLAKLAKDSHHYLEETRDKEARKKPRRFKVAQEHPQKLTTAYLAGLEQLVLRVIEMEDERLEDEPCPFCGAKEEPDEETEGASSITHEADCLGSIAYDLAEYGGLGL